MCSFLSLSSHQGGTTLRDIHFDGLARSLGQRFGRRHSMRLVAVGLLAAGSGLASGPIDAKKRKRRKDKKKKKKQPTCAQLCPGCAVCLHPSAGPVICGGGATFSCPAVCTYHSDCVGNAAHPYCLKASTLVSSGVTTHPCGEIAVCSDIDPC
jgi:hypothetical protein